MSDVKQTKNAPAPEKQAPAQVVAIGSSSCNAEGCKTKHTRAGFCDEHYMHFKEGLITMDGYKAKDYDKKYHAWMRRAQKAA